MTPRIALALCLSLAAAAPGAAAPAQAQKPPPAEATSSQDDAVVGTVQTVKGPVFIVRASQRLPAERGTRLQAQDVVRTEKGGAVGLILRDDTVISLGPSSELTLREFVYRPSEGLFASVLAFARGTMVYIAGRIAKLAPSAVRVETPVGVAAARGTKFMISIPR